MFDIKITGGQVFDGTGSSPVIADIGVTGDEITAIGDLSSAEADTVIDSSGKYVSPGFIDAHSHSDAYLLIEPSAHSKLYQGITTEVVGNCGASAAPLMGDYHMPADWLDKEFPGTWSSVAEYRTLLEQAKPAPNVVLLIGHNTLRVGVAGYENRVLEKEELNKMKSALSQALDEGARGLSTGLIYAPGMFAPSEELAELCKVAAKHDGIFTSHMRNEGSKLLDAIREVISIGKQSGVKVQISHLKVAGRKNWDTVDEALDLIRNAREKGMAVCADRYPYTASATELDVIFPHWAQAGGRAAALKRLKNSGDRARIRADLVEKRSKDYWSCVTIGSTSHADTRKYQGMLLTEAAVDLGMEPVDAVLHLCELDELKTGAFFAGMSEENMMKIFKEPYVMLGTDASLRAPAGPLSHDHPHPRAYGSFTRFLRKALDGGPIGVPEAIRKMTSLSAEQFGLAGRGVLAEKKRADIVVFDPGEIAEKATYAEPHQLSEGMAYVIVNGVITLEDGQLTGARAGQMLA